MDKRIYLLMAFLLVASSVLVGQTVHAQTQEQNMQEQRAVIGVAVNQHEVHFSR